MKHRRRKTRRNKRKYVKTILIILIATCTLSVGYAAFTTNISINVSGTAKGTTLATEKILNLKQSGDTTLIDDETDDHNIRYSGKNVNNYVCLKNENPCSDNNLYRIIGVFSVDDGMGNIQKRLKLVKLSVGYMPFDIGDGSRKAGYCTEDYCNAWAAMSNYNNGYKSGEVIKDSSLKMYLNSSEYSQYTNSLIDNAVWYLGGSSGRIKSSDYYLLERKAEVSTWTGKIALMHVSDYGFASKNCYKTKNINGESPYYGDLDCIESNWLFQTTCWFLNSGPNSFQEARLSKETAEIVYNGTNQSRNICPSFYLKSSAKIINNGNDGSESKPYILTN